MMENKLCKLHTEKMIFKVKEEVIYSFIYLFIYLFFLRNIGVNSSSKKDFLIGPREKEQHIICNVIRAYKKLLKNSQ